MCGRYANARRDADLVTAFAIDEVVGEELPPSWNVAPTDEVRAVLERAPRQEPEGAPVRQLRTVRWGLVPSWAKDPRSGARLINARSETVTEKPAFRKAAARRRCLLAADAIGHIHDRTPLLVPADLIDAWLDPSVEDLGTVREMVAAMPKPVLRPRPVSKAVGDVRNDGPELIDPVEP